MHFEGIQNTVISPFVYCLFLGSFIIEFRNFARLEKQILRMNVHIAFMQGNVKKSLTDLSL